MHTQTEQSQSTAFAAEIVIVVILLLFSYPSYRALCEVAVRLNPIN